MELIIIGAGGHGRVVLDIILAGGKYKPVGFLDNNPAIHGRRVDGLPILGDAHQLPDLLKNGVKRAVIAIGDNGARRAIGEALDRNGFEIVNAIHPSARIAANASLGKGVVAAAGSLVCAHCQIGDYVILNTGCIVDHESMIGTAAHICPGVKLAGHVTVESGAFVGIGSTVIQGVRVGFESIIGAGAVVIRDVEPMTTVVGVPAKTIKAAPSAEEFESLIAPAADTNAKHLPKPASSSKLQPNPQSTAPDARSRMKTIRK